MIRLLLDQGLPRSTVRHLTERGIEARHVGDIGHSRTSDAEIIVLARASGEVIVTLDADFHRLLAMAGASTPSVIRIRQEGLHGPELASLLDRVLAQAGSQLQAGAVVTVTEHRVRLHHLPLGTVVSSTGKHPG
jgi:predicted nuclease of predicted toxin-antitoxin system